MYVILATNPGLLCARKHSTKWTASLDSQNHLMDNPLCSSSFDDKQLGAEALLHGIHRLEKQIQSESQKRHSEVNM